MKAVVYYFACILRFGVVYYTGTERGGCYGTD